DYRVLAFDLRGHGLSAAPHSVEDYSMALYANDLVRAMDRLGIELCALAGMSFGGMVALEFAVTWPERLAALIVSDTSAANAHPRYAPALVHGERHLAEQMELVRKYGCSLAGKRLAKEIRDSFLAAGVAERWAHCSTDGLLGAYHARMTRPD